MRRLVVLPCFALLACQPPASSRTSSRDPQGVTAAAAQADEGSAASRRSTPVSLDYEVKVDPAGEQLIERVCFDGKAPTALTTSKDGARFATSARIVDGAALPFDSGLIETKGLDDACVEIVVSIPAMMGGGGWGMGTRAARVGDDLILSPSYWHWYPAAKAQRGEARVHFDLPPGQSVAIGWRRAKTDGAPDDPNAFVLQPSDYDWRTHAAFGRFDVDPVEVPGGGVFEVAILGERPRAGVDGISAWLQAAASAISTLFDGEFPRTRVTVLVIPVPGGGGPVHFGLVTRGGEPSVLFYVAAEAEATDFPGEWVAVHELTHTAMPLVRKRDAWMSEGFATYYQEILRARARLYDETPRKGETERDTQHRAAIEHLADGFSRGLRGSRRMNLADASDGMRGGFVRVYWGGAIVAFALDLSLRRASDGRYSLDDLMRSWSECCIEPKKIWRASDLFEAVGPDVTRATGQDGLVERTIGPLLEERSMGDPLSELAALGAAVDPQGQVALDPGSTRGRDLRNALLDPPSAHSRAFDAGPGASALSSGTQSALEP